MPFRRIRRRHTVLGSLGQGAGAQAPRGHHGDSSVDPVADMKKRQEAEEANNLARTAADVIAYFLALVKRFLAFFSSFFFVSNSMLKEDEEEEEETREEEKEEVKHASAVRRRYNKAVITNNVVDMFNSHSTIGSKQLSPPEDELMSVLEKKLQPSNSSPSILPQQCRSLPENVELNSMLYTGSS